MNFVSLYSEILFSNEKDWTINTCNSMDEFHMYYAMWKKADSKGSIYCVIPLTWHSVHAQEGKEPYIWQVMRTILNKTLVLASLPPQPGITTVLPKAHGSTVPMSYMPLPPTSRLPYLPGSTCSQAICSPQNQNHNVLQFFPVLAGKTSDLCYWH